MGPACQVDERLSSHTLPHRHVCLGSPFPKGHLLRNELPPGGCLHRQNMFMHNSTYSSSGNAPSTQAPQSGTLPERLGHTFRFVLSARSLSAVGSGCTSPRSARLAPSVSTAAARSCRQLSSRPGGRQQVHQAIGLSAHVPASLHLWMGRVLRRRLVHLPAVSKDRRSQKRAGTPWRAAFGAALPRTTRSISS